MGLSIGDTARSLPTFQRVGALQGGRSVSPARSVEPPPRPNTPGALAPVDRDEQIRAALREPVGSAPAAAVRALGTNFRAIREQQPSIEERREAVRQRFEQAREQIFGPERAEPPTAAVAEVDNAQAVVETRALPALGRDDAPAAAAARAEQPVAISSREPVAFRPVTPNPPAEAPTPATPRLLAQFQPAGFLAGEVDLLG